jgi:hypothetical protein
MPIILASQEAEMGGSQFKASLGKWFTRPYLKKKKNHEGITGFRVPLHSPICSLSLLFSTNKFSTNKIFLTSAKKKKS